MLLPTGLSNIIPGLIIISSANDDSFTSGLVWVCLCVCTLFSGGWSVQDFKGPRPPPCADFALISIDHWRAVLYGGDRGYNQDSKDLYIIDFYTVVCPIVL